MFFFKLYRIGYCKTGLLFKHLWKSFDQVNYKTTMRINCLYENIASDMIIDDYNYIKQFVKKKTIKQRQAQLQK